jgi:hypothetical protein
MKTALSSLVLLVTACGGGSGGDGTETDTTPNTNLVPVSLSSDNMEQASSIALNSVFNNLALTTSAAFTGVLIEQDTQEFNITDIEWALDHLNAASSLSDNFTGVVTTSKEGCSVGGSIDVRIDVKNANTLSINDIFTFTSNNCDDGSVVTNGTFTFKFTQLNEFISLDNYATLGFNVLFDNYTVKPKNSSDIVNFAGNYSLVINKDLYTQEADITSDKLTISIPEYKQSIENLIVKKIYTNNTNTETLSVSNSISDDALGGSVTTSTLEEFVFISRYITTPSSGIMKVNGADGSSITITVLNGSSVQLDADFDGNNTVDATLTTSWNTLLF